MRYIVFTLLVVLAAVAIMLPRARAANQPQTISPHAQALQLVLTTQQEVIARVDNPDKWWHDVLTREWSVRRPVKPGDIDSTHLFSVRYLIDGKVVASWSVDTAAQKVTLTPATAPAK
jgi:hypothetical protein